MLDVHEQKVADYLENRLNISRPGEDKHTVYVPPLHFAMVVPGIYRSGHPNKLNFRFLDKLALKSIMYLSKDAYRSDTRNWAHSRHLQLFHFPVESSKDPLLEPSLDSVIDALSVLLDSRNYPILVHDNKGRASTSLVTAIIRKFQHWSFSCILAEYRLFLPDELIVMSEFAESKPEKGRSRLADLAFVDRFPMSAVPVDERYVPDWVL